MVIRVSFVVNPIFINNGWSPWDKRLGGSEEAVVEWATRLSSRGYIVNVYHNGRHGYYKGVEYKPHDEFTHGDVTINVNYPSFEEGKNTIYFTSLTNNPDLSQFKKVFVLSEYAKNNTGVKHKNVEILPLGHDDITPSKKVPKQCIYTSSPDRGLKSLEQIWPAIVDRHPDAHLYVTYGGELSTPNTTCLGYISKEELKKLYSESDIWLHPDPTNELFCMAALNAQVAQCIPVTQPVWALPETVKVGVFCNNLREIYTNLNKLLTDGTGEKRKEFIGVQYPSWEDSTSILENGIIEVCK